MNVFYKCIFPFLKSFNLIYVATFLTNRSFWLNLAIVIGLTFLIIFGVLQMLGLITKHGEYLTVPSVTNRNTAEAIKLLESKGFDVTILDSVYVDSARRGTVLKQFPEANSTVKVNRSVLLTVNRVTLPMVDMPSLQGKSLTYALDILKRSHLELGDTTFKPDFMLGSVLEQRFKGSPISSGAKVTWGSKIDLIIGGGLADQRIPVPSLLGMTYGEAKTLLDAEGISVGALIPDPGIRDTAAAFVYKQNPGRFTDDERHQLMYIQSGQLIDIWISPVMKTPKDSTENPL
jgi:beta-lactam-binding protein with PASTA domain